MNNKLLETCTLGTVQPHNRVVMSPMTRYRANTNHTPTDLMAMYYGQRANTGLIITEGKSSSPNVLDYMCILSASAVGSLARCGPTSKGETLSS